MCRPVIMYAPSKQDNNGTTPTTPGRCTYLTNPVATIYSPSASYIREKSMQVISTIAMTLESGLK